MDEFAKRLNKCKSKLEQEDLDVGIVMPGPNFQYFSGYSPGSSERFMGLFIPLEREPFMVLPELEEQRAKNRAYIEKIESYKDSEDITTVLSSIFHHLSSPYGTIGIEGQTRFSTFEILKDASSGRQFENLDTVLHELRIIKSQKEIEYLKQSSKKLERSIKKGFKAVKPGRTEKAVARKIQNSIQKQGGDVPFCSVQSGPNSSIPHYDYGSREIKEQDFIQFDIGCRYKGYISDISRVVAVGRIPEKVRKIHQIVLCAQKKAIEHVKPGRTAHEIDKKARMFINEKGFGEYFIHRTGHGLGLEVHERPFIREGNNLKVNSGMVFTIEPGIYLPEKFGVRIEDNIVVTEEGYENLTTLDHDIVKK